MLQIRFDFCEIPEERIWVDDHGEQLTVSARSKVFLNPSSGVLNVPMPPLMALPAEDFAIQQVEPRQRIDALRKNM